MEPLTLLASAVGQYLIPKTLEKMGEQIGSSAIAQSQKSIDALRQKVGHKLKATHTDGVLAQAQTDPTESNRQVLEAVLLGQLHADQSFTQQIQQLVQDIHQQSPKLQTLLSSVRIKGDAEIGQVTQTASGNSQQVVGQNLGVAGNFKMGDVNQSID